MVEKFSVDVLSDFPGARTGRIPTLIDYIKEEGSTHRGHSEESGDDDKGEEIETTNKSVEVHKKKKNLTPIKPIRPASVEILNRVQLNNTCETPRSTIRGFIKYPGQTERRERGDDAK